MGLLEDIGMLIGILPIERPNFKNKKQEGPLYIDKVEELEKLNGQYVYVTDTHRGILTGDLRYSLHGFKDIYFLDDCLSRKAPYRRTEMLHVHDLQSINEESFNIN
jgi:hypothetical protein